MADGFIVLRRKLPESWLWGLPADQFKVAIAVLFRCNWKRGKTFSGGQLVEVERGQCMTSLASLAVFSGVSVRTVRTTLSVLQRAGFLTSQPTNRYRILTVHNYDQYQRIVDDDRQAERQASDKPTDKPATGRRQASDKDRTKKPRKKGTKESSGEAPEPSGEYRQLVDEFFALFALANGGERPTWDGRRGKEAKELLAAHGLAVVLRRMRNMFGAPPPWPPPPHDWSTLVQHFDRFAKPHAGQQPGGGGGLSCGDLWGQAELEDAEGAQ